MSDTTSAPIPPPVALADQRSPVILVYILYLAAVVSAGAAGIIGVIIAYIKRDEARGTIWESHYRNQIEAFWVWLVLFIAGCVSVWLFFIGFLIMGGAFIYFLYRTIKGLLLAVDSKPYA